MLVCRKLLHIKAAQRQIRLNSSLADLIKGDDFNQTVLRDSCAACGYKFLISKQAEADVFDFAVVSDSEQIIGFQRFFKADFYLLSFVDEGSRRFGYGNILSGINKFHSMDFIA